MYLNVSMFTIFNPQVKSELKRVEETNSISDRRYSAQSHFNGSQIKSNMTVDKTEIDQNSASDQLRRSNSKGKVVNELNVIWSNEPQIFRFLIDIWGANI